jgi:hypothetical protein
MARPLEVDWQDDEKTLYTCYKQATDPQVGSPGLCSAEILLQFRNHRAIIVQNAFCATEGDRP